MPAGRVAGIETHRPGPAAARAASVFRAGVRRCGRLIDARTGWPLKVGDDGIEPIVGSDRQHPEPDLFTDLDAIGFGLPVRYPAQIDFVDTIQVELLIVVPSREDAVRRSGDGGVHRRLRRYDVARSQMAGRRPRWRRLVTVNARFCLGFDGRCEAALTQPR